MSEYELPEPDLPDDSDISWDDSSLDDRNDGLEELAIQVVNWRTIQGAERAEAFAELDEWVRWIIARYDIQPQKIPDCWAKHGDLVEELSALHTAWLVAFDETDGGYGPIGWHERFAVALSRHTFRERCTNKHRSTTTREIPRSATE